MFDEFPNESGGGAPDEMSLDVEGVSSCGMDVDEALSRAGRFEAVHLPLSSLSHRLVSVFGPVVGTQTLVAAARESYKRQRRAVGSKLVNNNDGPREAPRQQSPKQLERAALSHLGWTRTSSSGFQ
jgi:hypothetical protein